MYIVTVTLSTFYFLLSTVVYYDAHTHLNDEKLFPQREKYLQYFVDTGGVGLVNVGVDAQRSQKAIDIAIAAEHNFPSTRVKATIGHHPSEVCFGKIVQSSSGTQQNGVKDLNTYQDSSTTASAFAQNDGIKTVHQAISSLKNLYVQYSDHIVAIGECGIDTHYDGDPHIDLQKELFAQQCDLAQELDLPIVIHSRDDFASTWDVIKKYKNQKIYFHCRGYSPDEVKIIQDHFPKLWIGFCGNISYPKAQILRDSLYVTRPESIVLETDAPYLAPQKHRGQTNQPALVIQIYDYVASITGTDPFVLQQSIADNVRRLYNIK